MVYQIDITLRAEFGRSDPDLEDLLKYLSVNEIRNLNEEDDPTVEEIDKHFLKNDKYRAYIEYLIEYVLEFSDYVLEAEYAKKLKKSREALHEAKNSKSENLEKIRDEYSSLCANPVYDEKVLSSISYLGNGVMKFSVFTNDEEACLLIDDFEKSKKKLYKLQMYVVDQIKEDSLEDGVYESEPSESPYHYESRKVPGFELGVFDHRNDYLEVRVEKL